MGELLVLITIVVVLVALLWPRVGAISLVGRFRDLARKEQVEDALKHLHHCEFSGLSATLESLSGALRVSRQRATDLTEKLEAAVLVTTLSGRLELTPSGRREALRVIRIHRLWEKYFADQSGLDETLWHDEADRREHTTSEDEARNLDAKLGHPRYDPHGAPIPTATGDLPLGRGTPLTNFKPGNKGRIVHVEDEPRATYEQLVAQGLTVGAFVRVLERSSERIRLDVDGEEQLLAPVVAGNVSVEQIETTTDSETLDRLSHLQPGAKGRVVGLLPSCRGVQRRRLLDLGLLSGTVVEAELQGPGGDPRAYRIRGALIALREGQSRLVQIETLSESNPQ
jgi:DtxR family transcriptional regulator, Mn-dependent transcriptional regulator